MTWLTSEQLANYGEIASSIETKFGEIRLMSDLMTVIQIKDSDCQLGHISGGAFSACGCEEPGDRPNCGCSGVVIHNVKILKSREKITDFNAVIKQIIN